MTLYYTRTPHQSHEKQTMLNCFLTYEEAVEQASQLLLITCFPSIEIVEMDTDKLFITLTRLSDATKDAKKNIQKRAITRKYSPSDASIRDAGLPRNA